MRVSYYSLAFARSPCWSVGRNIGKQTDFVFDDLVCSIQHCGFLVLKVGFAPPSKPVTIGSGKSHAVPIPASWKGNGVRSNRVFYK